MIEKKLNLEDILNNPGDSELINTFNKQLKKDMTKVYEESAEIEKRWNNQQVKLVSHRPCRIIKIPHIPDEVVENRYEKTLSNLPKLIEICDQAIIFDNTYEHEIIANYSSGAFRYINSKLPNWFKHALPMDKLGTKETEVPITDPHPRIKE